MKQYHDHLKAILDKGTKKRASREGMPGSKSLFGYQNEYDLSKGFPILTTKKISFKNIVVELLWFLRGDTNIKYLVDNGCNIWNEDAYNYYCKLASKNTDSDWNNIYMPVNNKRGERGLDIPDPDAYSMFTFEEFIDVLKKRAMPNLVVRFSAQGYTLGDCGFQYGKVWRAWDDGYILNLIETRISYTIDQMAKVIKSLKEAPEGRRHIVTAIDPRHDEDLALYWCHCMFQFNTRELTMYQRLDLLAADLAEDDDLEYGYEDAPSDIEPYLTKMKVPRYALDCQLYQRSADMFLGVPYNISSYALLTHIIAKICNMVPGRFIHTFGDSHIYDNHMDQVKEILSRDSDKYPLPKLTIRDVQCLVNGKPELLEVEDFFLEGYQSYPAIKAELSTGMKK
jgi:thymidylate synthase